MKGLKEILLAEQARLEQIVTNIQKSLVNAPEGTLRMSQRNSYQQFIIVLKRINQENILQKVTMKLFENWLRKLMI